MELRHRGPVNRIAGNPLLLIIVLLMSLSACKVSYSFSGANIDYFKIHTLSIQTFQNRASLVQPGLNNQLTNALIDKCKAQTKLSVINGIGDVSFEGEITDYNTKPLTIGGDSRAAMNRFTIAVKVKFTNSIDPDLSYDKSFSRYKDYAGTQELSAVESNLVDEIVALLVEDIFNEAFVKW
jgi:hypothetical protein